MRSRSITARLIPLVALAALLSIAATAGAQSLSVLSRDGRVVLVNKDVNGERWTITYDPGRGYVSGNVLTSDGRAEFVDCLITRDVPAAVDTFCYLAGEGWLPVGEVSLPRSFFGNWPIGGATPGPGQCPNIRGLRFISGLGTGDVLGCGFTGGTQVFVEQTGCRIAAEFGSNGGPARLEATLGTFGIETGTITRGGIFPLNLRIEGRGISQRGQCTGNVSPTLRYFEFDYFGGTVAGRGQLTAPRPNPPASASQAFLDLSADLFE